MNDAAWDTWCLNESAISGGYPVLAKLCAIFVEEAANILELGCSAGGNVELLSSIGKYHGVDASEIAVNNCLALHPECVGRVKCADFTQEIPFTETFDLIVDRASIPHNDLAAIRRALDLVLERLAPGGLFISSDWFSTNHSEAARGETVTTTQWGRTARGFEDGQFKDAGEVHFSSAVELRDLFSGFDRLFLQERITRRVGPGFSGIVPWFRWISHDFDYCDYSSAVWDLVARKPK